MGRLSKLLRPGLLAAMNRSTILSATERLGTVAQIVSSAEYLVRERDREFGGANNWDTTKRTFHAKSPRLGRVLDVVARRDVTRATHVARIAAGLALWAPLPRPARTAANAVLSGSQLLLYARHLYGTDGADQVSFLVQTLTTVARLGNRRTAVVDACLWFIALQSVLSYTVSGWAKLPSETWRSGRALPGITRTVTYGEKSLWELFERHPKATRALAHAVLAMECAFPAAFIAKGRLAPALLAAAGSFHLVNARVMGLGRFFWAFVSTYPSVLYVTGGRTTIGPDGATDRRDDALPAVVGALVAAAAAAGQIARARNAKVIAAGHGDEKRLTTSSGSVLTYRELGVADPGKPVVVFDHGLCATAEHWAWIAGDLARTHRVVTYYRAGYGTSTHGPARGSVLSTASSDLADLAEAVGTEAGVVLVGHSLGGYLAMLAAERLGDKIVGVGLVDASHPAELRRSQRQAKGADGLTTMLSLMPSSMRVGMGLLLKRPEWVDRLPASARALALAHFRDHRLWAAAQREWAATKEAFESFDGPLPDVAAPMLVITAGRTATADPVQQQLHDELAGLHPRSVRHTVADADHDEVLTHPRAAAEVVAAIGEFISGVESHETRKVVNIDDTLAS
jgi:pimeloyl-ACP methyl ester carboxylesterase